MMRMRKFSSALALVALVGCGSKNSLSGSVSEVYPLDFQTVSAAFDGTNLTIEYLKGADTTSGYTMKVVVDLNDLTVTAGQSIDLTTQEDGGPRGTFQQILSTNDVDLPFSIGSITLDEVPPVVGKELSGHFAATFTNPSGHALQGTFDVAKVAAVAP